MGDILVVDDQDRYIRLCREAIPEHRYRGPARNLSEALALLGRARGRVDAVLLDVHFEIPAEELEGYVKGMSSAEILKLQRTQGLRILTVLHQRYPDLPVIVLTSLDELNIEDKITDTAELTYFLDDDGVNIRSLQGQLANVVAMRSAAQSSGPVFWGRSIAMRKIRQRLKILARGRLPVVILGPTGTGKSLIAKHIVHQGSMRPGRFVAVDLSTVPPDLMAVHLFGSVKGAYTGSIQDRTGAFEAAHRGTLFLDEIGNLSAQAQKMLLSVLQEGKISRVGDLKERAVDVKVVVATNEDLAQRVRDGSFRADLFMRLNPATAIQLPPLCERGLDLEELLRFCLNQALQRPYLNELLVEYRRAAGLEDGPTSVRCGSALQCSEGSGREITLLFPERSVRLLHKHSWPGNLREFAMTVENAVHFAVAEMIAAAHGRRSDVITVRPKLLHDLLEVIQVQASAEASEGVHIDIQPEDTLNKVSVACERQYFEQLYLLSDGDFGQMSEALLGDPAKKRKVQLRFNQLGLKVRELKGRLG